MIKVASNVFNTHKPFFFASGLFVLIAYFPLFMHLGNDTIHAWDESMFAMRAYELANDGTFLENFGDYAAGFDNPNIKPPFGTYFQALGLKLFGYTELGLRLPVALFSLATGLLLIWIFYRYYNNLVFGLLSALVLICSPGYIAPHITRTGDHEGILVFLALGATFCLYKYIETKISKWCYAAAVLFALGFLTKSLVIFFPLPAILLYVLYKKQLLTLLRNKNVWNSLGVFAAILVIQYAIVWFVSPYNFRFLGLANVQDRFVNTVQGHSAPITFYWSNLIEYKLVPWIFLLPFGLLATLYKSNKPYRSIIWLFAGTSISHLFVISLSQTKLPWYDASVYPWLAVIAAFPIWTAWQKTVTYFQLKVKTSYVLLFVIVIAVFSYSYNKEVQENLKHPITSLQQQIGSLLKNIRDQHTALKSFTIIDSDPKGNLVASYYITSMNQHMGFDVKWQNSYDNIALGDTVGFCHSNIIHWADSLYAQETLVWTGGCKVVVLQETIRTSHIAPH